MLQFTQHPYTYQRFITRVIQIGNVPLGGKYPVRIQSMCNTNTMDTMATVAQSIRMIEAGCEYVRITAPGVKEAENLVNIKNELHKRGYTAPLIADIHFNPKAAEIAAAIVEKVRINPGNYVDRTTGKFDFTEKEYEEELQRIAERIFPLIEICTKNQTAIRIGTNHGSLSNRIVHRYGDTPEGMTESAMEFIRICRSFGFNDLVLSMKSSNIKVMVASTRLLVANMKAEGMNYPVHLGVTEAGDAEDGRIKSANGIGALLADGIGDTIRVSLTEDPEFELPVARKIVDFYKPETPSKPSENIIVDFLVNPYQYTRRNSFTIDITGNTKPVIIIGNDTAHKADYSFTQDKIKNNLSNTYFDLLTVDQLTADQPNANAIRFIQIPFIHSIDFSNVELIKTLQTIKNSILITAFGNNNIKSERRFFAGLIHAGITLPVIVKKTYSISDKETFQMKASADFGALLVDGFCDGVWIENPHFSHEMITETSFALLQASGVRITKTEFIACPSCGRTQFKIQHALKAIKEKTSHLKGLKIAVMGCIVNGPGEMADANYGYVGSGNGNIHLYKGKNLVEKNIPENDAVDKLIELIKLNGDWKENTEK